MTAIETSLETDQDDEETTALMKLDDMKDDGAKFPELEDFQGTALTLFRLQDTYELDLTQLTNGNILGKQSRAKLSSRDCLFIGKNVFNTFAYARALEWFEESARIVQTGSEINKNHPVTKKEVMELVNLTIKTVSIKNKLHLVRFLF